MAWSVKRSAIAAIGVVGAASATGLVAPAPALASEAPGCVIWADPPAHTSEPQVIRAVGHRAGCVQRRKEITVRIRWDISNSWDETLAEAKYTNFVNGDFEVVWHCRGEQHGTYFAEILTNAGGKDQSGHIQLRCNSEL